MHLCNQMNLCIQYSGGMKIHAVHTCIFSIKNKRFIYINIYITYINITESFNSHSEEARFIDLYEKERPGHKNLFISKF